MDALHLFQTIFSLLQIQRQWQRKIFCLWKLHLGFISFCHYLLEFEFKWKYCPRRFYTKRTLLPLSCGLKYTCRVAYTVHSACLPSPFFLSPASVVLHTYVQAHALSGKPRPWSSIQMDGGIWRIEKSSDFDGAGKGGDGANPNPIQFIFYFRVLTAPPLFMSEFVMWLWIFVVQWPVVESNIRKGIWISLSFLHACPVKLDLDSALVTICILHSTYVHSHADGRRNGLVYACGAAGCKIETTIYCSNLPFERSILPSALKSLVSEPKTESCKKQPLNAMQGTSTLTHPTIHSCNMWLTISLTQADICPY